MTACVSRHPWCSADKYLDGETGSRKPYGARVMRVRVTRIAMIVAPWVVRVLDMLGYLLDLVVHHRQ